MRMALTTIRFSSDSESPFIDYAVQLVALFCGIKLRLISQDTIGVIDVYHGNDEVRPCTLRIPLRESYSIDDIPVEPDKGDYEKAALKDAPFPFDLFTAIRFWLADEANSAASEASYDMHQRLRASYSAQETGGILDVPIVNHYLVLFREWLRARFNLEPRSMLPEGKKCGIVLSHDVDSPVNYGDPTHALWIAQKCARTVRIQPVLTSLKEAALQTARRLKRPGQRWWLFREIMDVESRYGFSSTFFFASRSRYNRGANPLDVWYDITAPRFKRVFDEINERGFEIGLHTSYNSHEHFSRIAEERILLEELCGRTVLGNRHHFWRMKQSFWDTLEDHVRAGLRYDSSIGFNDGFGFRLGIGLPFYPWNPTSERLVDVLQIPVLAMDGVFLDHEVKTIDGALERFKLLIEKLKAGEGISALDWHVRNSYPGSVMCSFLGELYLGVIEFLAADPEVIVMNCRSLYEEFTNRLESQ